MVSRRCWIALIVGYTIVPHEFFDRLGTLENVGADESAMGRVQNWTLAWQAALQHPLLGVGPDNHMLYNRSINPRIVVRVAHSAYFQVIGELGFVGLALYLAFVLGGLVTFYRTWRDDSGRSRAPGPGLGTRRGVLAYLRVVGIPAGSALLNMFYIEFPWYVVFYGSMLWPMVQSELAKRGESAAGPEAGRNSARLPRIGKRAPATSMQGAGVSAQADRRS